MMSDRDWKGAYEEESKTVSLVWQALGCKSYDDCKPFTIWEHIERLITQRNSAISALRALYDAIPTGFGEDRALNEATKQAEKMLGIGR